MRVLQMVLFPVIICGVAAVSTGQELLPLDTFGPLNLESVSVHGTIDVVISTRQGFVLATDSRASMDDGSHRDDAQKVFTVGDHVACVIAGLAGSQIGAEGFHLSDALASHIVQVAHLPDAERTPANVASAIAEGLRTISGLMLPRASNPIIDGEVSIVSFDRKGNPEWITFALPFVPKYQDGEAFLDAATPVYFLHPTNIGPRFGVHALGQPQVVNALIKADGSSDEICGAQPGEARWCVDRAVTHSQIMTEYYRRKRLGTLDGFTLDRAVLLARTLVEATMNVAPATWGVGGPVDIVTVGTAGAHWIAQKHEQPVPPPFHETLRHIKVMNGIQPLDGQQCLLCTFQNMTLFYTGAGPVELVRPKFEGECRLTLMPGAAERRPDDVRYLERIVSGHCQIDRSGRIVPPSPPVR